ncbi:MAG TPA: 4'-phosphopantetheinyl transferase superfamily protein [Vicinamibacteria bacterium]|nr:4'-phosphopantetheinyl transferase superfamily protein [Vicinamibacteria bacterium]
MEARVEVVEASLEDVLSSLDAHTLLDGDERARAARFRNAEARDRFLAGRGLLRALLGERLGRPPGAVRLRLEANGRPVLADPDARVRFSVSHAGDRVVVALADRDVGVDIERLRPLPDALDLARRFFAAGEVAVLASEPLDRRADVFLVLWTRKEALLKARGLDLADGLASPASGQAGFDVRALEVAAGFVAAVAARGSDWAVVRR